jgi:hypothetical protein
MIRLDARAFVRAGEVVPALARLEELEGPELVVVDVGQAPRVAIQAPGGTGGAGGEAGDRPELRPDEAALRELRQLPCLLVARAVGPVMQAVDRALADACDLCLSPPEWAPAQLVSIVIAPAAIERRLGELELQARRPETIVLAQLLRRPHRDLADGLLVESLAYSALQSGASLRSWLARR